MTTNNFWLTRDSTKRDKKKNPVVFKSLDDYDNTVSSLAMTDSVRALDALIAELIDSDGSASYDQGVNYSMTYQVFNPSGLLGANTAMNAVGWTYGDTYWNEIENDADDRAYCTSVTCDKHSSDDKQTRIVTVEFQQVGTEILERLQNPLAAGIQWSFKAQQEGEMPIDRDVNDQIIANKAGDKFADITEPTYTGVLKMTKNFAAIPTAFLYYFNKVNGDFFGGFPAKTLKLVDADEISPEFHPEAGTYYPITLYFAFKPDGWKKKVLNEGYREKVAKTGGGFEIKHIMINGEKTTEPMLLTADGKKAPEGAAPIPLEFETAYSVPFGGLIVG